MIETAQDRAAFFDADGFGTVGVITRDNHIPYEISGIFDRVYFDGFSDHGEAIDATASSFVCATDDLDQAEQGDGITINELEFIVRSVQPDGTGTTKLILEKKNV